MAVKDAKVGDLIVESLFKKGAAYTLRPSGGVQVIGRLEQREALAHLSRRDDIADTHAGGDDLRHAGGQGHHAMLVEAFYKGYELAVVAQLVIGVVLQHRYIVFIGQTAYLAALVFGKADARGVLEIRYDIKETGLGLHGHFGFEILKVDAVVIHADADQPGALAAQGVDGGHERGALAEDDIAVVAEKLGRKGYGLLSAGGDRYHIVGLYDLLASAVKEALYGPAQVVPAAGRRIVEH